MSTRVPGVRLASRLSCLTRKGTSKTTTALYRDFHYSNSAHTFSIQVAPGSTYGVRVYLGDAQYTRDNMQVTVEGGATP